MNVQRQPVSSTGVDQNVKLEDDLELLDIMLVDAEHQQPLYNPGPYWAAKARNAAKEIKKYGIADFRGSTNLIGMSYADNLCIDIRNSYNHGLKKLALWLTKIFPVNRIFDSQVRLTEVRANEAIAYAQEVIRLKEKDRRLLEKYLVPYSLVGKCLTKAEIDGQGYSTHYLSLLEQHDNIASHIDFKKAYSIFEIGGGFGTNVHLLLENYKNIRKVLYLDIPPNLYVGTQYLKAFYGDSVIDYRASRDLKSIKFSDDETLEIYCIAPWQIENFAGTIDVFMNSHSFVEMPKEVARNYAAKFSGFSESADAAIALTTYGWYNLDSTYLPSELPTFFEGRKFECFEAGTLLDSSEKNLFFVSSGKLSNK